MEFCYMYLKNGKYLASIIDNSVITCYEITDAEAKSLSEEKKQLLEILIKKCNLQKKKYKSKYKAKEKHQLPHYIINNKLKKVCISNILSKWRKMTS